MRDVFVARTGPVLVKSPNARHQAARRRIVVICSVLALAVASAVVGVMTHSSHETLREPQTGPFSYLPSQ
jgi:hypothetical protein